MVAAGRRTIAICAALVAAPCHAQDHAQDLEPGRLARDVTFVEQAPPAANDALMQRLLSPRENLRARAKLAAGAATLAAYPIDSAVERFTVYVPKRRPPQGYGLLVFVPPWQDARLPGGWGQVLDNAGMIFVSAARSGNDEPMVARRIPLALTAAYALQRRLPIDPERTLIGGFSGGGRVALRLALAYPDVFAGALLNAGSDAIGATDTPLPSLRLMTLLQTRSRFVFVTGADDATNQAKDAETQSSMAKWCVGAIASLSPPHMGHEAIDAVSLSWAFAAFDRLAHVGRSKAGRCVASLQPRIDHARAEAATLRSQSPSAARETALDRLDETYGALIEPD